MSAVEKKNKDKGDYIEEGVDLNILKKLESSVVRSF